MGPLLSTGGWLKRRPRERERERKDDLVAMTPPGGGALDVVEYVKSGVRELRCIDGGVRRKGPEKKKRTARPPLVFVRRESEVRAARRWVTGRRSRRTEEGEQRKTPHPIMSKRGRFIRVGSLQGTGKPNRRKWSCAATAVEAEPFEGAKSHGSR